MCDIFKSIIKGVSKIEKKKKKKKEYHRSLPENHQITGVARATEFHVAFNPIRHKFVTTGAILTRVGQNNSELTWGITSYLHIDKTRFFS